MGVELAGAFPPDMQTYIVMVAGVSAKTAQAGVVRGLLDFLTAPAALPVITARGMERMSGAARRGDDPDMIQEPIEQCRHCRGVAQQLPQSSTGRLDVSSVDARSYRGMARKP